MLPVGECPKLNPPKAPQGAGPRPNSPLTGGPCCCSDCAKPAPDPKVKPEVLSVGCLWNGCPRLKSS